MLSHAQASRQSVPEPCCQHCIALPGGLAHADAQQHHAACNVFPLSGCHRRPCLVRADASCRFSSQEQSCVELGSSCVLMPLHPCCIAFWSSAPITHQPLAPHLPHLLSQIFHSPAYCLRSSCWCLHRPAQQEDPPEEFYDFTAEDLVRVTAAKAAAQGPMLTRALRERRTEATAGQYGPVPVRVLFPGDVVIQVCIWQKLTE